MADDEGLTLATVTPGMKGTHQIFRREFPLSAELVTTAPDGDAARARTLADHVHLLLDLVQVHHDAEEQFIWDLLPGRDDASAEIVATMFSQHGDVHDASDALVAALDGWVDSADAAARDAVSDALGTFSATLVAHADLEEAETLGFIADNLTPAEWGAFVQYASTAMPEETRGTVMGMLLEDMPPAARDGFLGNLPAPFAEFLRTTGAEAYAAYTAEVRGS